MIVLIGGGAAAAACAAEIRRHEQRVPVTMVGREAYPPYDRTVCSKRALSAGFDPADSYLRADWCELGIDVRLGTSALALDPGQRTVSLSTGEDLSYDAALLATGANVRRIPVPGAQVQYVRTLANAAALGAAVADGTRVTILGGSFLACELAASLLARRARVCLVMPEAGPLAPVLGPAVGGFVAEALRRRGARLVTRDTASHLADGVLCTANGVRIPSDLIAAAAGATPDTMLAARAGLEPGATGGVPVDALLRTAAPDLLAAGDVCELADAARFEHWRSAEAQGRAAARTMLGLGEPYVEERSSWSDLGDWLTLECRGRLAGDVTVVRAADDAVELSYRTGGTVLLRGSEVAELAGALAA